MAEELTAQERLTIKDYLLKRAYPLHKDGTRDIGSKEFYAELSDQPDRILKVLYASARAEEARRKAVRQTSL